MGVRDALRATFFDHDGSFSIPEITASIGAFTGIGSYLWDFWARGGHFDLQSFGVGVGGMVLALGTAQRIRDGLWKDDR